MNDGHNRELMHRRGNSSDIMRAILNRIPSYPMVLSHSVNRADKLTQIRLIPVYFDLGIT